MRVEAHAYPVLVRPLAEDEGSGFLAEAPDLPGCMSDGDSPIEAVANVQDAIRCWIAAMRAAGRLVPLPSRKLVVTAM
jgi:predicted RNase H-like HicB family nuclease